MCERNDGTHRETIIDQFTRQAIPFSRVPGHRDALQMLVEISGACRDDTVLDVACGPGMVACEFARRAAEVTGIDITPAMIGEAEKRQWERGLVNLRWVVGDAVPLPFTDDTFSLVITRYSFHHFRQPERALAEMIRVCKPGGRVMVADVAVEPEKSAAYDRLEKMRDPSHTHALTTAEFDELFSHAGLEGCRRSGYGVSIGLETQLQASFPDPEDVQKLREMVTADIGVDRFGINARREKGDVIYTVPISVYVGWKR